MRRTLMVVGSNQFRTADQALDRAQLKARVFELKRQSRSYRDIGAELGIANTTARNLYLETLDEVPVAEVRHYRAEQEQLILDAINELLAIARDPTVNPRERVAAYSTLQKWDEHRAKLFGTYAPSQQIQRVITEDAFSAALREVNEQIAAMEAAEAEVD